MTPNFTKPFMLALAGVVFTSPALADVSERLYVQGSAGLSWLNDADNQGDLLNIESSYDNGYALAGALGVRVSDNIRVEGEIGYRKNDGDSLEITNDGGFGLTGLSADADGDFSAVTGLVNAYYDVTQISDTLMPYVMGGLGFARIDADISTLGTQIVDDSDTVLAYQIGAGVGFAASDKITLDLGYRYLGTQDPELRDEAGDAFDSEYSNHTLRLGVRYAF